MADIYSLSIRADTSDIRRGRQDLDRFGNQADNTRGGVNRLGVSFGGLAAAAGAAATALGAVGLAKSVLATVKSTQVLQASLKTVTGSTEAATAAWSDLLAFAKTTPFTLDQSVQGFIRMKSLGLDPTEKALRSFGNTSAAMGKDLMQMIEAVADASTGEFERLKEFGIRASTEGDKITFTFQGVETTVKNSSSAITGYLEGIGSTTFAGAMADQMDTLAGKTSNLEDGIDQLYRAIGDAGATSAFESSLDATAQTVETLTENIDTVVDAAASFAIIIAGSVVGALTKYAAIQAASTVTTIQSTNAQAAASVALLRRTGAEKAVALALINTTRLDVAATAGTNAHTFALTALTAARSRATAAAGAHAAATATATSAMTVGTVAARGLTGAMALLGGPVGIILIAAASLYYFRDALFATKEEVSKLQPELDGLTDSMNDWTVAQFNSQRPALVADLREARSAAMDLSDALAIAEQKERMSNITSNGRSKAMGANTVAASELRREYQAQASDVLALEGALSDLDEQFKLATDRQDDAAAASAKTTAAIQLELKFLRAQNTLIEAGVAASEAEIIIREEKLRLQIQGKGLTLAESFEYVALGNAIDDAREAEEKQASINTEASGIADSLMSEEASIIASYERRRDIILDSTNKTGEAQKNLLVKLDNEKNELIAEQQKQGIKLFTDYQQTALSTVGQIFGNMADIAEKGGEKQFATWKAMATAQAVVSTALAISNALASAPPPFNFALAATVGALGAVQVAQIQQTEYQGARAMGGSVSEGGRYMVGENGPEVVTMGGSGVVTPSSVGGGGMSVVINDQTTTSTGHDVQTQESTGPEGQRQMQVTIRDTVRRQVMQGEFDRQLGSKFDLKSKGRRV